MKKNKRRSMNQILRWEYGTNLQNVNLWETKQEGVCSYGQKRIKM